MPERVFAVTAERTLPADPDLVWALLSDTNRWDRAVGLAPSTYEYKLLGDPPQRQRVGFTTFKGHGLHWLEAGEWEEGRFFRGERHFLDALVPCSGFKFTVERAERGAHVAIEAYSTADKPIGEPAAEFWKQVFARTLDRYLAELERLLAEPHGSAEDSGNARARRLLACAAPQPTTNGRLTKVDQETLDVRAAALDDVVPTALRDRIVELLRDRADEAVTAMRPFELAHAWGADPREVLRAFLHAARAGLVDLNWQLNCPVCRVGAGRARTLTDVARRVHCDECDISFDLDFAANIEAVFAANPAIRAVRPEIYCAGTPFVRPHVYALFQIEPGGERSLASRPSGALLVRALGRQRQLVVEPDARVAVAIDESGLSMQPDAGELRIVNRSSLPTTVLVERMGATANLVRGTDLITLREFHDLFGTEAPAAGIDLQVGTLCVVFTDVVGSMALYERLGDSAAYALVQDHFRAAHDVVARHEGSLIKTLGDGMMLCFAKPDQALAAALELATQVGELAIRVGVHQGPCYIIRANDRLDLFGTTINVAARLCRLAAGGQVVASAGFLAHESVQQLLGRERVQVQRLQSQLKGFSAMYQVAAIDTHGRR